jgi:hypothetical protein
MDTPVSQPTPDFEERCLAITDAFRRMFGCDPTPGTVEPIVTRGYSPETSAQLVYDICTLVHMVIDPILDDHFLRQYGVPRPKNVKD